MQSIVQTLMRRWLKLAPSAVCAAAVLAVASAAQAQPRPYIGFVYPAGGQRGTTFQIRLGGQGMAADSEVFVSGKGVRAKVLEYLPRLNPQEHSLLREQLAELKRPTAKKNQESLEMMARIELRLAEYVNTPACNSISNIMLVEVTIDKDAEPGPRELILSTLRGVSNPLVFHVGQVPEVSRKPMLSAVAASSRQGGDGAPQAARRRGGTADHVALHGERPDCFRRGEPLPFPGPQGAAAGVLGPGAAIGSLHCRRGARLVSAGDGVYDAQGKELAYDDDYRFKPDPVILFEVPKDGEYMFTITDAIYRGREDFVYRVTVGELPFVTSIFPLGGRAGQPAKVK